MRFTLLRVVSVLGCSLSASFLAVAGEIKSDEFSIAVGANVKETVVWTLQETEASNVGPGDKFSLDVHLDGGAMSATGPTFKEKVLGGVSGGSVSGIVSNFLATVTGKYTGPAPKDAANPPNYRVQVNVTAISIYAAAIGDEAGSIPVFDLNFNEVTYGHETSQDVQPVEVRPRRFTDATNYVQISWAPKSYPTDPGALDQEQGRIFDLTESQKDAIAIDGFEITGNIVVTYDSKP